MDSQYSPDLRKVEQGDLERSLLHHLALVANVAFRPWSGNVHRQGPDCLILAVWVRRTLGTRLTRDAPQPVRMVGLLARVMKKYEDTLTIVTFARDDVRG